MKGEETGKYMASADGTYAREMGTASRGSTWWECGCGYLSSDRPKLDGHFARNHGGSAAMAAADQRWELMKLEAELGEALALARREGYHRAMADLGVYLRLQRKQGGALGISINQVEQWARFKLENDGEDLL